MSKNDPILSRLRLAAGYMIPSSLFVVACIIMQLPWQIEYFSTIKPELPIIVIFFWICLKPSSITPMAILIGAVITDIFSPMPLGFYSLLYFLIYGLILWRSPQLHAPNLALFFGEFAAVMVIFYVLLWLFNHLMGSGAATDWNIVFAWGFSLCAFWILLPLLSWIRKLYPLSTRRTYNFHSEPHGVE